MGNSAKKLNLIEKIYQSRSVAAEQYFSTFENPQAIASALFEINSLREKLKAKNIETLKVKLILIDVEHLEGKSTLEKLIHTQVARFLNASKFGLIHSAIQVGSYVFHFFNDSLIHATTFRSKNPLAAIDIGEINIFKEEGEQTLQKLCQFFYEWNSQKKYDSMKCNCHHFTSSCMKVMKCKAKFGGQLGKFLKKIRHEGDSELFFSDPITKSELKFETHQQLDEFILQILKEIPDYKEKNPDDWMLLKCYDRAFWLGYFYANSNDEDENGTIEKMKKKFKPTSDCWFGNPIKTGSVIYESKGNFLQKSAYAKTE